MNELDDILIEFISEGRDMVEDSVPRLIELQQLAETTGNVDDETLNAIFRTFHSIKGTAAFLEFNHVNKTTHAAENLLDRYRKHQSPITGDGVTLLLQACDFLQNAFVTIEKDTNDLQLATDADTLIARLTHMIDGPSVHDAPTETQSPPTPPLSSTALESDLNHTSENASAQNDSVQIHLDTPEAASAAIPDEMRERFIQEADDIIELSEAYLLVLVKEPEKEAEIVPELFRQIHSFKGNCGFMGFADLETISHRMETQLGRYLESWNTSQKEHATKLFLETLDTIRDGVADISKGGDGIVDKTEDLANRLETAYGAVQNAPASSRTPATVNENTSKATPQSTTTPASTGNRSPSSKVVRRDIRVDLEKLDTLVNLVGELVIAQAMVTNNQDVKGLELENFEKAASHLDRIVRDLQDVAMSVRMIPISGSFRKMIRLVHDLSRKFDKKIKLDLTGEDTEIDKTVAELIADPLVHIIRNAVDHGLESSQERLAADKPEVGTIHLEARHEGGEIWILIKDDGRGLDRDTLLKKGREKGLVDGDGSHLSNDQVYKLLFEPGFSTAAAVTDVSGRGVGMDVVRKNIEKLKGQIDVQTTLGRGTSFILKIPLTLAIIEGMLVRVGNARYTIPMLSIRGCIRSEEGTVTTPMENHEVIKLRERLLPIVRLYALHGIEPDSINLEDGAMVIIEDRKDTAAVFVDEILGQHQTVIKGLSDYMGDVHSVSGCTIMGDGDVSLILDPAGLISLAKQRPDAFHA